MTAADLKAQVAQSVEQRTENPRVDGSIPSLGTIYSLLENQSILPLIDNRLLYCFLKIALHCWNWLLNHNYCSKFFRWVTPRART